MTGVQTCALPILNQDAIEDIIRFNEAIDQAVSESVADFSKEAESWRQVFLGVLGHDLRGPLHVILMTSELMSHMALDAPFSEQVDRISRSGERMNKLLNDLLDHSRTALGMGIRIVRSEGDLCEALSEEIDLLRATLPEVSIKFDAAGPVRGQIDVSRIREALSNLVTNAAKYGNKGGDIHVMLSGDEEEIQLVVRNQGAALSSDALTALFEPLQRGPYEAASDQQQSLGLGLFIVREVVKAHGGAVTANSSEDTTAFTMRFPRKPPSLESSIP